MSSPADPSQPELSDEELMKAYMNGDSLAFTALYGRYEKRLYSFIARRLAVSKRDSAADLFQKTWLKVHQSRASYDPSRRFSAWLYTVAANALRDQLDLAQERLEILELESQAPSGAESPEDRYFAKRELESVRVALAKLPNLQREALILSEWEGLSGREICEVLKVSEGHVRQLVFRARAQLQKILSEGGKSQ